ncbi:DUF2190 family protein [Candidatus Babeliales bacterium]|nr:DUF2190 family protein [Candidatus Babeliales bacterium]
MIQKEESYSINIKAVAKAVMPKGTVVKLDVATGEVEPCVAVTDKAFGILTVGALAIGDLATVQTQFNTVLTGVADGIIAIGDEVSVPAEGKYKKSVATNVIAGIALSDAADAETVTVGIIRTFSIKA